MKKTLIFLFAIFLSSCSITNKNQPKEKIETISMITLIANPEKFHNKRIRVDGYFCYEKEGDAIYVNKSDFENLLFKNGVYLHITSELLENHKIERPYRGHVSIEGTFNKNNLGSHGLYSGTIVDITSIYRLYKRGGENDELNMD